MIHKISVERDKTGEWEARFVAFPVNRCSRKTPTEAISRLVEITPGCGFDVRTVIATKPDSATRLNFTIQGAG